MWQAFSLDSLYHDLLQNFFLSRFTYHDQSIIRKIQTPKINKGSILVRSTRSLLRIQTLALLKSTGLFCLHQAFSLPPPLCNFCRVTKMIICNNLDIYIICNIIMLFISLLPSILKFTFSEYQVVVYDIYDLSITNMMAGILLYSKTILQGHDALL